MKLFTKQIDGKLYSQFDKGSDIANQKVVAKIFNPYGRGTWYLINSDPSDPDYIWAIVDLFEIEVGSVSRAELQNLRVPPYKLPLERDMSFIETNAQELLKGLRNGKTFAEGGDIADQNKEMLKNQAVQLRHHTEELMNAIEKSEDIEPWVITKAQRAATDLSDITHYLDGANREDGEDDIDDYDLGGKLEPNKALDAIYKSKDELVAGLKYLDPTSSSKYFVLNNEESGDWLLTQVNRGKQFVIDGWKYIGYPLMGKIVESKFAYGGDVKAAKGIDLGASFEKMKRNTKLDDYEAKFIMKMSGSTEQSAAYWVDGIGGLSDSDKKELFARVNKYTIKEEGQRDMPEWYGDGGMINIGTVKKTDSDIYFNSKSGTFHINVIDGLGNRWNKLKVNTIDDVIEMFPTLEISEKGKIEFNLADGGYMDKGGKTEDEKLEELSDYLDEEGIYGYTNRIHRIMMGRDDEYTREQIDDYLKDPDGNGFGIFGYTRAIERIYEEDYEKGGYMSRRGEINVGDVVGNTVEGFDWKVISIGVDYLEVENLLTKEIKKTYIDNMYPRTTPMAAEGESTSSPDIKFMKWFVDWSKSVNENVYVSISIPNEFSSPIKDGKGKIVILDVIEKKGDSDAKKYMNEILEKADEFGVSIYLEPIPRTHNLKSQEHKDKITKDYLIKYYQKLGFENTDGGFMVREPKMAGGGKVTFEDKVAAVKASLLKRKKVSPKVQKDYGKTYSPAEAEDSAKRIVGAMTAKERLMKIIKKKKKAKK